MLVILSLILAATKPSGSSQDALAILTSALEEVRLLLLPGFVDGMSPPDGRVSNTLTLASTRKQLQCLTRF
jgi:hypothetical protein